MLETLNKRIAVQHLVLERPAPGPEVLDFDPSKDLLPDFWERIEKHMANPTGDGQAGWRFYFKKLMYMKALNPNFNIPDFNQETVKAAENLLDDATGWAERGELTGLADDTLALKTLGMNLPYQDYLTEGVKRVARRDYSYRTQFYLEGVGQLKQLFPSQLTPSFSFNLFEIQERNDWNILETQITKDGWNNLSKYSAKAKLQYQCSPQELGITSKIWSDMKQRLQSYDNFQGIGNYAEFAFDLRILSAQNARITEEGLVITPSSSPSLLVSTPTVPERRKF